MRTRVKVCGITCSEDARLAADAGADAIGFVFAPSPRRTTIEAAAEAAAALPPWVCTVGVFVDEELGAVTDIVRSVGLTDVQLHGSEPPGYARALRRACPVRVIKAFRVGDASVIRQMEPYRGVCSALLLDACVPGAAGGTGRTFDWALAVAAKGLGVPVILAGGLTPENAAEAVRRVRPYAVDTSSGVEAAPGRKDPGRVRAFLSAVQRADQETAGDPAEE